MAFKMQKLAAILMMFVPVLARAETAALNANVAGTGLPGFAGPSFMIYNEPASAADLSAFKPTLRIDRHALYRGGRGIVHGTFHFSEVGPDVTNSEWGTLFQMNNKAKSLTSNNLPVYIRADKMPGAGPTWATAIEVDCWDANPSSSCVNTEMDIWANGSDRTRSRIGLDLVAAPGGNIPSAVRPEIAAMFRIGGQNGNPDNADIDTAIDLNPAHYGSLIKAEGAATFVHGIDLSDAQCVSGGDLLRSRVVAIRCDGQIGVGTANPEYGIDVVGETHPDIRLKTALVDLRIDARNGSLGTQSNSDLRLMAAGLQQARGLATGGFEISRGKLEVKSGVINAPLKAPSSSKEACSPGDRMADRNYIYICTAKDTWKRASLSAF